MDYYKLVKPHYSEPHRFYHTIDHIDYMLEHGKKLMNREQYLAVLFHDIVYDAKRKDNEEKSTSIMYKMLDAGYDTMKENSGEAVDTIANIILDTKTHKATRPESEIVLDLDLLGMSESYETFRKNSDNIRKEFSHLSNDEWSIGRSYFFRELLKRPQIFVTNHFSQYESDARRNIERELNGL